MKYLSGEVHLHELCADSSVFSINCGLLLLLLCIFYLLAIFQDQWYLILMWIVIFISKYIYIGIFIYDWNTFATEDNRTIQTKDCVAMSVSELNIPAVLNKI